MLSIPTAVVAGAIHVFGFALTAAPAAAFEGEDRLLWNRDIRPILSDKCFACHGPGLKQPKGGLRLDLRQSALRANSHGKAAIAPGSPDSSLLTERVSSDSPRLMMPPPTSGKQLSPREMEKLRRWIAQGAEYQNHWAYVEPERPALPALRSEEHRRRVKNPIDSFILAALEERQIEPSPEAEKRTLLRRLSFDLIGLPPEPEELESYLADGDPRAYEHQVERLLNSPHYGERMAMPWLDVVRFAETVGYHGDQHQRIFPYRDYVIESFNSNKPFDRFTLEQLAGDLLPGAETEAQVASGFNRLNMMTREGGAQPKEYLARYAADRVRTVAMTWLGSTMGCTECHDHKFDPFTSKDFYSMEAFFADVKQWGVYNDYEFTPNPELRHWSYDHPFPPEIEVSNPYLTERQRRLEEEQDELFRSTETKFLDDATRMEAFEDWALATRQFLKQRPEGWETPAIEASGADLALEPDGIILVRGRAKPWTEEQVTLACIAGRLAAIRLEVLPHARHDGYTGRLGAESSVLKLTAALKRKQDGALQPVAFSRADADAKEDQYLNGEARIGVKDGWATARGRSRERQASVWLLDPPLELASGDRLVLTLRTDSAGCVRVLTSPIAPKDPMTPLPVDALAAALEAFTATGSSGATDDQQSFLARVYLQSTAWDPAAFDRSKVLGREIAECRGGRAFTMVTQRQEPLITRVLPRGNWQDESGEVVLPAVPHFLPQPPDPGRRLTRLDLARWLTSPRNPLTARVVMNRLWKQLFGAGISGIVEDLGAQGEPPSHPELLDWLAVEFRESGWDLKHMVSLMVTSSTYRQCSRLRPEVREIDPQNRLLSAQSPLRLTAELVRDNALAIAGLLNRDIGGPSVKPYQPPGYYANLNYPARDYDTDDGERQYRRGLYVHWQRTFLHPMLANFDAPSREECTASRALSNTPQQALTLLNDPTFVEAARVLAERNLTAGKPDGEESDRTRIERLFHRALSRPASEKEQKSLASFLAEQRTYFRAHPDEAAKLLSVGQASAPAAPDLGEIAAWASLCRVVLNLHETITRY